MDIAGLTKDTAGTVYSPDIWQRYLIIKTIRIVHISKPGTPSSLATMMKAEYTFPVPIHQSNILVKSDIIKLTR